MHTFYKLFGIVWNTLPRFPVQREVALFDFMHDVCSVWWGHPTLFTLERHLAWQHGVLMQTQTSTHTINTLNSPIAIVELTAFIWITKMTPRLQRSQALSYPALSKSSGAAYCSVKQGVCRGALPAGHRRANPKSITFRLESSPSSANSTFCKIKCSDDHLICLFTRSFRATQRWLQSLCWQVLHTQQQQQQVISTSLNDRLFHKAFQNLTDKE